ncbi:uncharacterized protein B0P05DRAFT_297696 [Gilbertella persicaria]|uniref:uncharacterized protein n=1 Tax=Gilbertella persicaria TaxID=101096 RepID=UPI002220C30B|nr:uncharacterized protein B0P05DRAFT_297696 [Gilbertella persicaria]KAI8091045.1 hypothetical protein B0P05DRAFT_297696 [Gilbertella persicaria]
MSRTWTISLSTTFRSQNLDKVARMWQIDLVGGQLDIDLCFDNPTASENIGVDYVSNSTFYMRLTSYVGNQYSKFLDVIQKAGSIITGLNVELEKIYMSTLLHQNEAIRNMTCGHYLDDIFAFCVNMKKVVIENANIVMCKPESGMKNSIETLKLSQVQYYSPLLFELSARLPNLKYLTINNFKMSLLTEYAFKLK